MRSLRRASLQRVGLPAALAALTLSCGGDATGPRPLPPATGSLRLTAATTGGGDDANGYTFSLDGGAARRVSANGVVTLDTLASGGHVLTLGDLASGCTLDGPNPRGVNLAADAVTDVAVSVWCASAPTHPAGTVAATRTLSAAPGAVAVSRDGVVYAALAGTTQLVRGDLATMTFGTTVVDVHATPIRVAFNPAGTTAYVALAAPARVAIVNVATNQLSAVVQFADDQAEYASDAAGVAVSPDGSKVYVSSAVGHLWVMDAATLAIRGVPYFTDATGPLAFAPDGKTLYAAGHDGGLAVVDVASNTLTSATGFGQLLDAMAISPDGRTLYAVEATYGLTALDVASSQPVFRKVYDTPVVGVAASPDGAQLYVTEPDHGLVRVYDRATMSDVGAITTGGSPREVLFDPSGTTALVVTDQGVVFVR